MVARFTSTTITTLLRKVAAAAKQVHPTVPAPAARGGTLPLPRGASGLRRARNAVEQVIRETFPSLHTPQLHPALEPIRLAPRHGVPRAPGSSFRYGSTSAFRTAYRLPHGAPRGAAMNAHVGLGSARTFASGPTQSLVQSKVPIGFRAFASLLNDEDHDRVLPRASRYRPYSRPAKSAGSRLRRSARRVPNPSVSSVDSVALNQLSFYFPRVRRSPGVADVPLPPTPETLVTPGKTTTLSLPLSPDLHALLEPTTEVTYQDAEIGLTILAHLPRGVLDVSEAFDLHRCHRIIPLVAKLQSLGVLDNTEFGTPSAALYVVRNAMGQPDILRITFVGRSVSDVHALLGESLRPNEEGDWWYLHDADERPSDDLTPESRAILEDWQPSSPAASSTRANERERVPLVVNADSSVELVLPLLDADAPVTVTKGLAHTFTDSWPSSGTMSPLSASPPSVQSPPLSDISLPSEDFPTSLTASLLSELSQPSISSAWEVPPTDTDSDVESAISLQMASSEVWSEGVVEEEIPSPEMSMMSMWSGAEGGFGFAQPW
ncbi:hypothetical protein JCM24511_00488 [Saitozyma sp. JCM 24511]|nr:hypothetical protein JCM24511_00488 [Saitozyma sp. JCM 24511]